MRGPVALFVPSLRGGGAERAMLDVARGLAERGLPAHLVLVRAEGPYMELLPAAVRVVDLGARRALTSVLPLVRYLRSEAPSVMVATLPQASIVAFLASRLARADVRLVIRRASHFTMEYVNSGLKHRFVMLLEKAILPIVDAVVVNSSGSAEDLRRRLGSTTVEEIHNPIVWPEHAALGSVPVDEQWFDDPTLPVVLSVGRLVEAKDQAMLLRAFAQVVEARRARLVLLGEGPERTNLVEMTKRLNITRAVEFAGFRVNPFAYMSKASVCAVSSRYEGSPNVLIQAMACGTPVVSTDCPSGPREILQDGKLGALVPVGDANALAAAIIRAFDEPGDPDGLVARAKEYDAESSIDAYLSLISRVAQGRT